jgi:hypothetical protein
VRIDWLEKSEIWRNGLVRIIKLKRDHGKEKVD